MNASAAPLILSSKDSRVELSDLIINKTFRPRGLVLPSHFHEYASIAFTVEGHFDETVGAKGYAVEPQSAIVRPAGDRHANRYAYTPARCLIIEIKPQRLGAIREVTTILDRPAYFEDPSLFGMALRVDREMKLMDDLSPLSIEALTLEMLVEAARDCRKVPGKQPSWLKQTQELLHEEFSGAWNLSEIAHAVGIHPAHIAKMFRRYYGCTVGDYVRRQRLRHAIRLLADIDRPISEVAAASGFYDQSHFAHFFKLQLGITPGAYRQKFYRNSPAHIPREPGKRS